MTRSARAVALLTGTVLAAGCSDALTNPTGEALEEQVTLDALTYAGTATVDDIQLMLSEGALLGGPAGIEGQHDFSVSRSITFYDENGDEMDQFDPLLTASVHIVSSVSGTRSRSSDRGSIEVTVNRDRDVTISGLLGEETERQWDGTGSASENRVLTTDANGTREYDMSESVTIDAVVIPVPRGSGYPLSGTITRTLTLTRSNGEETFTRERTVSVTFNGTRYVTITIDGEEFTLDLETREIVEG